MTTHLSKIKTAFLFIAFISFVFTNAGMARDTKGGRSAELYKMIEEDPACIVGDEKLQNLVADALYHGKIELTGEQIDVLFPNLEKRALTDQKLAYVMIKFKSDKLTQEFVDTLIGQANIENPMAQNNLGWMYLGGRGVKQDDTKAVTWYRKAAEQGLAVAQYDLGRMSQEGRGVKQDDREAFKWYQKAAVQGHAEAQNVLKLMKEGGKGR